MQHAVVATEDRRFYSHGAIDPIGIGRAILTNIQSGETVEGGSTISQQVVKNVFLSQDRTFARKAQEFVMAFLLEQNYSKDEILEIYSIRRISAPMLRASTMPPGPILRRRRKN